MKKKKMLPTSKGKTVKLRGNSLVFTIVISLVLSLLCLLFILIAYYNKNAQISNDIDDRLSSNLHSATNLLLADTLLALSPVTEQLDLFGKGNDSVLISRKPWGILQVAQLTAFQDRFTKSTCFFYGSQLPDYMNASIYLADHRRPLSLVGNTKITGDIYTSKAGVQAAYIDKRGFENKKLLEGVIKISADSLPDLRPGVRFYINELFQLNSNTSVNDLKVVDSFMQGDSLVRSFKEEPLLVVLKGGGVIENKVLRGNIMIASDSALEIKNTAILENIIVIAPVIKFESGFRGAVQAFAQDSLVAENNCSFQYPSALVLTKRPEESIQNRVTIKKGTIINGWVMAVCDNNDAYKSFIEIQENAVINGVLYVNGYISLQSVVNGVILADYFMYKTPAIIYENYLLDIEINRPALSGYFVGSAIFSGEQKNKIIEWLQ